MSLQPISAQVSQDGALQIQEIILSLIGNIHTAQLVLVTSVDASTETCSIQPLVLKVDANNKTYERGIIQNVPFFRLQGGANAIICNPKVGDIGLAVFCERDISMVKRNRGKAIPNSHKPYDLNNAVYIGSYLTSAPSQYIEFLDNGMNIKTTGDININGMTIKADGTIITKGGVTLDTHIHSQGSDSHGDTEQDTGAPHNG